MPEPRVGGGHPRQRYGLLLAVLVASFAVQGIAPAGDAWRAVVSVLLGAALLLAFRAADMPARRLRIAGPLVATVVGATLAALLFGDTQLENGFAALADALLVGLAPPAIVVGVVRSLRARRAVTVDALFGALCLYLLAGMFFAFVYSAIDQLSGSAFFAGGVEATPARAIYFSLATLTTVGYGDLTASTNLGRTLAVTEALAGQVYLVTVVSVVVANLVPRSRAS
jgi:ion channel